METLQLDALISDDMRDSLEKLDHLTPEQLRIVVEFIREAGGFEQARAAIEALEDLSDAA